MKTSPETLTLSDMEKAAKKAEYAAKLIRGAVISMQTLEVESLHVSNAGALGEGITRLTTFANAVNRAFNADPNGPDKAEKAPKRRQKKASDDSKT